MTPRAIIHPEVPDDIRAIIDYFNSASPDVYNKFLDAFDASVEELLRHPLRGSPKDFGPGTIAGLRSWQMRGFEKYLILYEPVDAGAVIVAVCHGARDLATLVRKRS